MKALRKSLNASKDHHHQISTPLPPVSKPSAAIVPPQKVIRAVGQYRSTAPQELSFQKGDFFYVIREVNEQGAWYEAHNPMTGARGLVPRALFEEFKKGAAASARTSQALTPGMRPPSMPAQKTQTFYAVVLHDFVAERPDELDAKSGDSITVVAQSNREWFVAKPIGRLGKPGLIPVSFVQIRNPATNLPLENVESLMDTGTLPRVEEWKKQMLNYKANSIPLGTLEETSSQGPVTNSPFAPVAKNIPPSIPNPANGPSISVQQPSPHPTQPVAEPPLEQPPAPTLLPEGLLLSAEVASFHYEMDEYWFRINVLYQPFNAAGSTSLPPAMDLVLFRAYNDFFDYQTTLIDLFPREAGREEPYPRIIPYMPGPAEDVSDALTAARREELDEYIRQLARLSGTTARYVTDNELTRGFLALKPGDAEEEADPQYERMEELGWYDPVEEPIAVPPIDALPPVDQVEGRLSTMKIGSNGNGNRRHRPDSDGSDYGDDASAYRQNTPSGVQAGLQQRRSYNSQSNGHRPRASESSHSRDPSQDGRVRGHAPQPSYSSKLSPLETDPYRASSYSHSSTSSVSRWPEQHSHSSHNTQATSPTSQSRSSVADSARSQPLVSPNNPRISASNPQTAFIKIKIFDRVSDDLIAIRVHPKVTHEQLMDKVQARLGGKVASLSFRQSVAGGEDFVPLEQDHDLRTWLESTDKHVLYAD